MSFGGGSVNTTACQHFQLSWGPQSFFKALFIGTKQGDTLKRMTLTKAFPEGLTPQECEHGSEKNNPPIPYILKKDKLQEAIKTGAFTIKLMLLHKVEIQVSVRTSRTPWQFVMHNQHVLSTIRQKSLKEAYKKLMKTEGVGDEAWRSNARCRAHAEGQDATNWSRQKRPLLQPITRLRLRWPWSWSSVPALLQPHGREC